MTLTHNSALRVANQCAAFQRACEKYDVLASYMAEKTPETDFGLQIEWKWGSACTGYTEMVQAVRGAMRDIHFSAMQQALVQAKTARDDAFNDLQHVVAHHA